MARANMKALFNFTRHISHVNLFSLRGLETVTSSADIIEQFRSRFTAMKLRNVNLISGSNGSGKSTIVDAIRSLAEPDLLVKLRRENIQSGVLSGIWIEFDSGSEIFAHFEQTGTPLDKNLQSVWNWQKTSLLLNVQDVLGRLHQYFENSSLPVPGKLATEYLQPFENVLSKLGRVISAWPCVGERYIPADIYAAILNKFRWSFPVICKAPPKNAPRFFAEAGQFVVANDELHIYHGDDLAQSSRIESRFLPSGWIQIVELLSWMQNCDDNTVCVIDEPEKHLHPTLQRLLIRELAELRETKNLQFVIATHSPIFLNEKIWKSNSVALFRVSNGQIIEEPRVERLLDELGCKATDIKQSNGVIWVEGPSDRIYVKAFLHAWRSHFNKEVFIENVHYSFCYFNGSCLTHFSGENDEVEELIQIFGLNRNVAICMDQDADFCVDDFGNQFPKSEQGETKMRVATELISSGNMPVIHVTDGYTMENYVSSRFPQFVLNSEGKTSVKGAKMSLAKKFAKLSFVDLIEIIEAHPGLKIFINQLAGAIEKWNYV